MSYTIFDIQSPPFPDFLAFSQETTFIEQVVEDESQMESVPPSCSRILNWHLHLDAHGLVYPRGWLLQKNLEVVQPIK